MEKNESGTKSVNSTIQDKTRGQPNGLDINQVSMSSIEPASNVMGQRGLSQFEKKQNLQDRAYEEEPGGSLQKVDEIPQFTIGPSGGNFANAEVTGKKYTLKKNAFDSDLALTTPVMNIEASPSKKETGLSKSANQARVLRMVNENTETNLGEMSQISIAQDEVQEQEMRETSYFKQQTDDEKATTPDKRQKPNEKQQSLSELIMISNNQKQLQQVNTDDRAKEPIELAVSENSSRKVSKGSKNQNSMKEGIQMFKISSKSQMKQNRSSVRQKKVNVSLVPPGSQGSDADHYEEVNLVTSPKQMDMSQIQPESTKSVQHMYQSNAIKIQQADSPMNRSKVNLKHLQQQISADPALDPSKNMPGDVNVTGNFGALKLQKQFMSGQERNNYSILKGKLEDQKGAVGIDVYGRQDSGHPTLDENFLVDSVEPDTAVSKEQPSNKQMFTSMSDIGFPQDNQERRVSGLHGRGKLHELVRAQSGNMRSTKSMKGELLTIEQIQKLKDTNNNWRVRTTTIDQILHDVMERVEKDQDYIMFNSERLLDFFVAMLGDQNFKIVLNSLHVLNLIVSMPLQGQRYEIMMNRPEELPQEVIQGRHIPQLVKKLADSKAIIRQEAIKSLFYMNEIMRSGNQKENNFIALILPYLNNSSNWHIREELLNLLIKCFIYSGTQAEFDCYQILDSILQLLNDTKEKIRSLALEAIAAFASIGEVNKISEVMFQLNIAKEVVDLVSQRLEHGVFPQLADDGTIEVPYLDNAAPTYDVDSVAHSMTQASQQGIHMSAQQDLSRRKPSIGGGSQSGISYKNVNQTPSQGMVLNHISIPSNLLQAQHRGNSSGRKIVVGTANAGVGGGLLVSQQDEMVMQQAFIQSKRTASANAPGHFDAFQPQQQNLNQNNFENGSGHYPQNSFNYSINGNQPSKRNRENSQYVPQFLDEVNSHDNGQSFLPQLQKNQFSSYSNHRDRTTAGGGASSVSGGSQPPYSKGYDNSRPHDMPISMTSKRANKYIHGTPGHNANNNNYHVQLSGHQQNYLGNRGNSGRKLVSNHQLNSMTSDQSPSLFEHQMSIPMRRDGTGQVTTFFEMSGNVAHMVQPHDLDGSHFKHMSALGGSVGAHQNLGQWIQQSQMQSEQGYPIMVSGEMSEVQSQKGFHNQTPIHYDNQAQLDPDFDRSIVEERKNSNSRQRIQDSNKLKAINIQNQKRGTFYSEQTNVTGTTAATGATSKIVGQGPVPSDPKMLADQPTLHNFQAQMAQAKNGPIKATRAALAVSIPDIPAQEGGTLIIDSRRYKAHQPLSTKGHKKKDRGGPYEDDGQVNKSFSHADHERNLNNSNLGIGGLQDPNSAGLRRSGFIKSDAPIGEEQGDPALTTQSSKIQYIDYEDIEPLENAAKEFKKATSKGQGIFSADWQVQFDSCNIFRCVCKHHQSLVLQTAGNQLQTWIGTLLKLADSLRSAVSKVSLVTIKEMFIQLKRVMEPSLDPIIKILLKKGSDTNGFIAQEADLCLIAMIQNCQEMKVLQILQLQNMQSRSNLYRLKICQCLLNLVKSLGNNILFFNQNDKLLIHLANYLHDASQDVRSQAKEAFVAMSQAIMGQNELERLLQRVLNEAQYKKVKEMLDKEQVPSATGGQLDFVITTSSQQQNGKRTHGQLGSQKTSFKALRPSKQGGVVVMTDRVGSNTALHDEPPTEPLHIQAKSMMHPLNKQDSGNLVGRHSQQGKPPKIEAQHDHFFIDSVKDLILKTQINEWRQRFDATEQLFDLLKANMDKFQRPFKMLDLADALCRLINDTNAKIQQCVLENFSKLQVNIRVFIEGHLQLFYKALLANLGSSNLGVRKASDSCLQFILQSMQTERLVTLIQPLTNMISHTNNARLKASLVDQLVELLQDLTKNMDSKDAQTSIAALVHKHATPLAIKLMDDNKSEFKLKCDKLLKKLYQILGQQALIDATPQSKMNRIQSVCVGQTMGASGDMSNGKSSASQGFNTGTFGANGNQVFLNSRN